jgi:hypothetical protein
MQATKILLSLALLPISRPPRTELTCGPALLLAFLTSCLSPPAGAFDAPEQAAHAHDIGALCSGKARTEALNFPLTDYDTLMPMLYSLPHVSGI